MKITYLGTGAAEGVPAMFCKCPICENIRRLGEIEFRTRSQVLIDGILSVDFPPEAYSHALKRGFNCADIRYVLATHSHMDHFYAHDFILRGYKYGGGIDSPIEIYGNAEVLKVFTECTAREMKPSVRDNLILKELKPYCRYAVGEYSVLTLPANHSKSEQALLFFIERCGKGYLHLYDTSMVEEDIFDFLSSEGAKAQIVSLDCTYADRTGIPRPRHMNVEDGMVIAQKLRACGVCDDRTRLVITHFSHNCNPLRERLKETERLFSVTAAYDGMEIEV